MHSVVDKPSCAMWIMEAPTGGPISMSIYDRLFGVLRLLNVVDGGEFTPPLFLSVIFDGQYIMLAGV